jgi:transcriptional regulator with XRE-family HTH domain
MIGNNIRKLRLKYELTQEELAVKLGVSSSAIGNYERETRQPDIDMLIKMADTFDITIDELVGRG